MPKVYIYNIYVYIPSKIISVWASNFGNPHARQQFYWKVDDAQSVAGTWRSKALLGVSVLGLPQSEGSCIYNSYLIGWKRLKT